MTIPSASNAWVICPQPSQRAQARLFCFPYAGGGPSIFRTWPDSLSPQIQVCLVQLPGRGTRLLEPPFTRLTSLVQTLGQALDPDLDVPFAFFGHSMGALLGFELARQLRRQGKRGPFHLFVAGQRAPQIPDPNWPIHELPDPEFMKELRRLNGTPEEVLQSAELMKLMAPVLRADLAVVETYIYSSEDPLDCPISAFGGLQDSEASREEIEAWRDQTSRSFTLCMFPGDHFFLNAAQAPLLCTLSQDLLLSLSYEVRRV